jgi:hypothetical protein
MGLVGVSGLFAFFFSRVGLGYWVICCFGVGYSDVGAIFFFFFLLLTSKICFLNRPCVGLAVGLLGRK